MREIRATGATKYTPRGCKLAIFEVAKITVLAPSAVCRGALWEAEECHGDQALITALYNYTLGCAF